MGKLATIRTVADLQPIDGADLEKSEMEAVSSLSQRAAGERRYVDVQNDRQSTPSFSKSAAAVKKWAVIQ